MKNLRFLKNGFFLFSVLTLGYLYCKEEEKIKECINEKIKSNNKKEEFINIFKK